MILSDMILSPYRDTPHYRSGNLGGRGGRTVPPGSAESHAPFAPALVVEALSPWSADRDVGPKFAAYEEHGVQEYWILDPDTRAHRFYHRQGEELVEFAAGEPLIRAHAIPGFWVRREWLNADPLPEVAPCLEQVLAAGQ
jgi:hypothetical protein